MDKKYIKWAAAAVCVAAAGLCYSLSGMRGAENGQEMLFSAASGSDEAPRAGDFLPADGSFAASGSDEALCAGGSLSADGSSAEEAPEGTSSRICYIHIAGAVMRPGVYQAEEGSRLYQIVEMAGGFAPDAAQSYLNLAMEVDDGMKVVVPALDDLTGEEEAGEEPEDGKAWILYDTAEDTEPAGSGDRININTAGKEELMALSGIGEARAEAIIRFRQEQGPFETIEDIMKVPGIKQAAFEKIKDRISV